MKKNQKLVLKQTWLHRYQGQIWRNLAKTSLEEPITTSGMICTMIIRR